MMNNLLKSAGRGGNAGSLYFDGISSTVNTNLAVTIKDTFSITLFSKMINQTVSTFRNIISSNGNYQLGFALEEGRFLIYDRTDLAAKAFYFPRNNDWTFFTIIHKADSKLFELYIDDIRVNTLTYKSIITNIFNLECGIRYYSANFYTNMGLSNLKYYNRILSPNEINLLSQGLPISRVGLVGEWKMNEMDGNIAYDTSGNGNHATIYGANYTTDKPY